MSLYHNQLLQSQKEQQDFPLKTLATPRVKERSHPTMGTNKKSPIYIPRNQYCETITTKQLFIIQFTESCN